MYAFKHVLKLSGSKGKGLKKLNNLVVPKGFKILAISSFKRLYTRAKCHPNGVKKNFFQKITKIAQRLGTMPPDPLW